MITGIDHLGIAVHSIDETLPFYESALGIMCRERAEVPSQMVKTAFLEVGGVHLELLEPTSPESPIAKFLARNGPGIHHVAFASSNIVADLSRARDHGTRLIHEEPIEGAAGKVVAFLHPKSSYGVLTELCQPAHESISTQPAHAHRPETT